MSPEERTLIVTLFERVKTASAAAPDRDAEALINEAVRAQPSAPYYLAQAVIVQEKGLEAAAARIDALEAEIRHMKEQMQPTAGAPRNGSFLNSIFGFPERPQPAYNAPLHPQAPLSNALDAPSPAYHGPWDRPQQQAPAAAAGGFLRGAMGTAAGVAGGMLLANSLSGLFGNHMSSLGLGNAIPAAIPVEETVVNNYYGNDTQPQTMSDAPTQGDDGWQQADLDTGGSDDGFSSDFDGNDTMDV